MKLLRSERPLPVLLMIVAGLLCASCASNGYSQKNISSRDSQKDKGQMTGSSRLETNRSMNDETETTTASTTTATASTKTAAAAVRYVALGDSTGVGVGAREGGYVARLFKRIERERPGSRLENLCVSGATTGDVLRGQVARAVDAQPTLVTLGIGINDIGHGVSPERFAGNYEEIIKRLKARNAGVVIVVANIPDVSLAPVVPPYMREEAHNRVVAFNEKIKEIAARQNLVVADAYSETREVIPQHPEFFSADGFHPSDIGYEYWAKTMWPTVKQALDKKN